MARETHASLCICAARYTSVHNLFSWYICDPPNKTTWSFAFDAHVSE